MSTRGWSMTPRVTDGERLLAQAQGFKWEAPCSRANCQSATIGTSGAQYYTLIPLFAGQEITGLAVDCVTGGAALTLVRFGLVSTAGAILASSGDIKAAFTAIGVKAGAFSASYTPLVDGAAYASLIVTHTGTGPNLIRMQSPVLPNAYGGNALPHGRRTGLSDLAAQVPSDGTGPAFWFGVI